MRAESNARERYRAPSRNSVEGRRGYKHRGPSVERFGADRRVQGGRDDELREDPEALLGDPVASAHFGGTAYSDQPRESDWSPASEEGV